MPPVRPGRVATRSATSAVHTRRRGGRAGGSIQVPPARVSIQVPPVGDGEANANVVQNIDPPVPVIDAGQEGASVMALDPRKFEEIISTSIAKGVEIGVAMALAILEPGRSAPTHVASDGPNPSTSSATSALPSGSLPVASAVPASTSNLQQPTPSSAQPPANVEMSNIIAASSLPPQLPGRPAAEATAQSNPLDFMVPQKIKDKIWAREFVELSTLLLDEDQGMELQISSHSSKPTFTLVPKTKREVNTIACWTKAFNCFTAVYSRKWPEEIPGLLKHMEVVVGLADDTANWKAYDKGFRRLHANGLEQFGQINIDLYLSSSRSPFHKSSGQSGDSDREGKSGKGKKSKQHTRGFCFKFHSGKKCDGCDYKYTCYNCQGHHAVTKCRKGKDKPDTRTNPRQGKKHTR